MFTADGRMSVNTVCRMPKVTKKTGKTRKSTLREEVVLEDVGAETVPMQGGHNHYICTSVQVKHIFRKIYFFASKSLYFLNM